MPDNERIMQEVVDSEEYKELDPDTRKEVNGLLALLATGTVPPEYMAAMVLMTAMGVALRDNEKLATLVDGGIWHRKGTGNLVVVAGGWAWELTIDPIAVAPNIDYSDLERM